MSLNAGRLSKRKVLIHIGQPKAFSSSIQSYFESISEDNANFLGYCPSFTDRKWYIGNLASVFELGLRVETNYSFEQSLSNYRKLLDEALCDERINICSSEAITFKCFDHEIDTCQKIRRLKLLFSDDNINFLYVWRLPSSLMRSFYGEYVKLGIATEYNIFLKRIYEMRSTNFYWDMAPSVVANKILHHFPNSKIHLLVLGSDKNAWGSGLVDYIDINFKLRGDQIPHLNMALDNSERCRLLELNKEKPRLTQIYSMWEMHRIFPHLTLDNSSWVWEVARTRRQYLENAKTSSPKVLRNLNDDPEIQEYNRIIDTECSEMPLSDSIKIHYL